MRKIIFGLSLLLLILGSATAETVEKTIYELYDIAALNNLDLQNAWEDLKEAEENLGFSPEWEKSTLSLNSSYTSPRTSYSEGDPGTVGISTNVSVPILPQLSFSGRLNDTFGDENTPNGSVSISISPFAEGTADYATRSAYAKAEAAYLYQEQKLKSDVFSAALALHLAREQYELDQERLSLQTAINATADQRLELDDLTWDEYQQLQTQLLTAENTGFNSEKSYLNALMQLYGLLGPSEINYSVAPITLEEIETMIGVMTDTLPDNGVAITRELKNAYTELDALNQELADTRFWDPNLSINASVNVPDLSWNASVGLSISRSSFNDETIADLKNSIADKEAEIREMEFNLELEERIAKQSVEINRKAITSALINLERQKISTAESALLYEQGEQTIFEKKESELDLVAAELSAMKSLKNMVDSISDLKLMYILY